MKKHKHEWSIADSGARSSGGCPLGPFYCVKCSTEVNGHRLRKIIKSLGFGTGHSYGGSMVRGSGLITDGVLLTRSKHGHRFYITYHGDANAAKVLKRVHEALAAEGLDSELTDYPSVDFPREDVYRD
jgi:hypothetical protein